MKQIHKKTDSSIENKVIYLKARKPMPRILVGVMDFTPVLCQKSDQ